MTGGRASTLSSAPIRATARARVFWSSSSPWGARGVASTDVYNDRVLYGGEGWANFALPKTTKWVRLTAVIKLNTIDFYTKTPQDPAPVFDHTSTMSEGVTFDCVVVGSGLSTRTDVWFDNIRVTPEPASLVLLAMGGLMLVRRRS